MGEYDSFGAIVAENAIDIKVQPLRDAKAVSPELRESVEDAARIAVNRAFEPESERVATEAVQSVEEQRADGEIDAPAAELAKHISVTSLLLSITRRLAAGEQVSDDEQRMFRIYRQLRVKKQMARRSLATTGAGTLYANAAAIHTSRYGLEDAGHDTIR